MGYELLSFMDAYSGSNQIPMYEPNKEHTSFITDRGLYCYKVMSFGLKNVGTTYQKLVNMMFKDRIGKRMEVYVKDMLVKSKVAEDHMKHLGQLFEILRKYHMKLNPLKCIFGVGSGKFLSFMVNQLEIEANLEMIKAFLDMNSPRRPKEAMSLVGRVVALSKFMSRATNHCVLMFIGVH